MTIRDEESLKQQFCRRVSVRDSWKIDSSN